MSYETGKIELTEEEKAKAKQMMRANLAVLRRSLCLSQEELGKRVGLSRVAVSRIECGKSEMTWSQFISFLLLFLINRSTERIIIKNGFFSNRLFLFLECKREGEGAVSRFSGLF